MKKYFDIKRYKYTLEDIKSAYDCKGFTHIKYIGDSTLSELIKDSVYKIEKLEIFYSSPDDYEVMCGNSDGGYIVITINNQDYKLPGRIANHFLIEVDFPFKDLKIEGLNEEQLDHILFYFLVVDDYKIDSEESFMEAVMDYETEQIDRDTRRWWIEYTGIAQIGNRYFGYNNAETTGDRTPWEAGFEQEFAVYEYQRKEVMKYKYILKV